MSCFSASTRPRPHRARPTGAVLLLALVLVPLPSLRAKPTWNKIETADEAVYGNISQSGLTEFAVRYAAYRHALSELVLPKGIPAPATTILIFRDPEAFQQHLNPAMPSLKNCINASVNVDTRSVLAIVDNGDRDETLRSAFESETVWLLMRMGMSLPLWMSQGTGKVFSWMRLRHNECVVGDYDSQIIRPIRTEDPIDWPRFFEIGTNAPEYLGKKGPFGLYHAQCWALMHAVLLGGDPGSTRERFERLAKLERQNLLASTPDIENVSLILGVKPDKITRSMLSRHSMGATVTLPFDEDGFRSRVTIKPVPEYELRVQLADFAAGEFNKADADTQLMRAEELAPDAAIVIEAQAREDLREHDVRSAAIHYRQAIQKGSANPMAFLVSAQKRLDDGRIGGGDRVGSGGPEAATALGEIRQAIKLDPSNGQGYLLLGRALFVAKDLTPEAPAELGAGLIDPRYRYQVRFYRALVLRRLGKDEECDADLRLLAEAADAPLHLRQVAESQIGIRAADTELDSIMSLCSHAQWSEAHAALEAKIQREQGGASTQKYGSLLRHIEDNEAASKLRGLLMGSRWAELRDGAEDYLKRFPNGESVDLATDYRAAAVQALKSGLASPDEGAN